jgi:hypothetical protein
MEGAVAMTILAFPLSPRTAHQIARRLRTDGFWTMPPRLWNGCADLAEALAEYPPTPRQLVWLRDAHQQFLEATR